MLTAAGLDIMIMKLNNNDILKITLLLQISIGTSVEAYDLAHLSQRDKPWPR